MSSPITATGRGKLIVFGEHSVVYGQPAVACSLPRGARATIARAPVGRWSITHPGGALPVDEEIREAGSELLAHFELSPAELSIEIRLQIPVGCGLGSSAAMAVALARAAAELTGLDEATKRRADAVARAAAASEAVFHGSPSGIDQRAALGGGFFSFRKAGANPAEQLDVPRHTWIVARVAPSRSTARMVEAVAELRDRNRQLVDPLFEQFGRVATAGAEALRAGQWSEVGELMNLNQGLLNAIGVSTATLESACMAARDAGALGAKLTGSGGGGCIIALADEPDPVAESLSQWGDVYTFSLPEASRPSA